MLKAFALSDATQILTRTPAVLEELLGGLGREWIECNEGANTWTPYDVVGHLIHGEKTDWIPRMRMILGDQPDKRLPPFDMTAQFRDSQGKSLKDLLSEFKRLRAESIDALRSANLNDTLLARTGIHPKLGPVTLSQHLATWVAHDLDHIMQISRVMAKRYKTDVGPWVEFLRILRS